ncbi:cobaltochelatase subunit CobN [Hathewaya limosa]|uniref:Cobaltochelatase CobN n=1 Tax=Hathewaya limosa TaxID=1536 RepID=A0ABU0JW86_HATLI|nr:cobaltochelatase subunit CobN [Hathewaya limosa]MDQ0480521.1 cobaltochelatase CobN [Hathewaya limosa]
MFKISFLMSSSGASYTLKEINKEIKEECNKEINLEFLDSYKIQTNEEYFNLCIESLKESNIIFVTMHGGVSYFKKLQDILKVYKGKKRFFIYSGVEDENIEFLKYSSISKDEYKNILNYYVIGGKLNLKNMVLYLASVYGNKKYNYKSPKIRVNEGIYYPNKEIKDPIEYMKKINTLNKPIVAILFYCTYYFENDLRHIDKFIEEIESLGAIPVPIYTASAPDKTANYKGIQWVIDNYLINNEKPMIDVIINTMAHAQSILGNPGDGTKGIEESIFDKLDVPVIQAMNTYQSLESWKNFIKGIDMMALTSGVYDPEYDGQIISVPTACSELIVDEFGDRYVFKPIEERVNKVCRLALNWAKLRKTPNENKKVAIIFHNMPPRNDMIGCAFGLDTPASVFNMVESLKKEGISLEYNFKNGDEIIEKIIDAVSNDEKWLTPEKVCEKSVDLINKTTYNSWFSKLSPKVQEKMEHDWGKAPGEFMVFDDNFPVPGIINGNIFIGLQPARGYEEHAEEVYHSTDIVPPHQYIAFYKWIKNVFKADVIVHVGTHGSLEWLPGKEIGLSRECYPDINIDDIPHLYPYIIDVPGEGVQAKRRSYAVILDHLIPSLMKSGTYGEIASLDELLRQYYFSKTGDLGKLPHIQKEIIEFSLKNNFLQDLKLDKEYAEKNFEDFVQKLHGWIEEIKGSFIKDGLHIFGQVPQEERLENLIKALLVLPNGDIKSLLESICTFKGKDYKTLKDNPYDVNENGETNLMILDYMENISTDLIHQFYECNFNKKKIKQLLNDDFNGENTENLENVLEFVSDTVIPKLNHTVDELDNFIEGINGNFVHPGASGCPTRGKVNILPTGRNFYTIDPLAVPSRAAWKVGMNLGDELLEKYLKEEGKYPHNIAIVVYAGETMKTCGDDIAEILYLMGVKPKWLGDTDKVIGMEVIPLEQLKRPRIDVTLRITGLFRDTFPNLIELIENAVNKVSSLEEDINLNYLRGNILKEVDELIKNGMSEVDAREEASMRIFGCPPGTYGAGVDILINSKNWENSNDLGDVYTLWGGHSYGSKVHGKKVKDVFARRLANTEITIKNESSIEIDMLDSDDFYNYHGGLISAVKKHSGSMPKSYSGNSSDPSSVKIKDINEETSRIMRSRILNPKWFEGLKKHGYKGAQEISAMVDIVFGWDATSDIIEDWMYEKISEEYLFNEERCKWINEVNPWAVHNMTERLLEANQRGMWNAKKESLEKLRKLYLSVEGDLEDYV